MPSAVTKLSLGIIGDILAGSDKRFLGFSDVVDAFVESSERAKQQLQDFQHFDLNPKFRTRVISVPKAIEGAQDLWDAIRNRLIAQFTTIVDETRGVIEALKHLPARGPGESTLQHAALILSIIHALNEKTAQIVREVLDFTQTIDDIKTRIETFDDLFLSQDNPRQRVQLRKGKSLKLRIGNLHSADIS